MTNNGCRVSFEDDANVLKLDSSEGCTILCIYKTILIVYFKRMNFIVCEVGVNFLK